MRSGLRWTLGGTLVASGLSWFWPGQPAEPVVAVADAASGRVGLGTSVDASGAADTLALGAARLVPVDLKGAVDGVAPFDPFVGVVVAPPPPPAPVAPPPPPPPAPPEVGYRFFGRIQGVDGSTEVYLSKGDAVVRAQAGVRLDDGYVIESVAADAVHLAYPPLAAHALIALPAATDSESR